MTRFTMSAQELAQAICDYLGKKRYPEHRIEVGDLKFTKVERSRTDYDFVVAGNVQVLGKKVLL